MMRVDNQSYSWQQSHNVAVVRSDSPLRFAIIHMRRRQPIILAETAARMWELITQGNDFGKTLHLLKLEYDKSTSTIEPFLNTFISDLVNEGYLKRATGKLEERTITHEVPETLGGEESRWKRHLK